MVPLHPLLPPRNFPLGRWTCLPFSPGWAGVLMSQSVSPLWRVVQLHDNGDKVSLCRLKHGMRAHTLQACACCPYLCCPCQPRGGGYGCSGPLPGGRPRQDHSCHLCDMKSASYVIKGNMCVLPADDEVKLFRHFVDSAGMPLVFSTFNLRIGRLLDVVDGVLVANATSIHSVNAMYRKKNPNAKVWETPAVYLYYYLGDKLLVAKTGQTKALLNGKLRESG